jgi:hypothetical protein
MINDLLTPPPTLRETLRFFWREFVRKAKP